MEKIVGSLTLQALGLPPELRKKILDNICQCTFENCKASEHVCVCYEVPKKCIAKVHPVVLPKITREYKMIKINDTNLLYEVNIDLPSIINTIGNRIHYDPAFCITPANIIYIRMHCGKEEASYKIETIKVKSISFIEQYIKICHSDFMTILCGEDWEEIHYEDLWGFSAYQFGNKVVVDPHYQH